MKQKRHKAYHNACMARRMENKSVPITSSRITQAKIYTTICKPHNHSENRQVVRIMDI